MRNYGPRDLASGLPQTGLDEYMMRLKTTQVVVVLLAIASIAGLADALGITVIEHGSGVPTIVTTPDITVQLLENAPGFVRITGLLVGPDPIVGLLGTTAALLVTPGGNKSTPSTFIDLAILSASSVNSTARNVVFTFASDSSLFADLLAQGVGVNQTIFDIAVQLIKTGTNQSLGDALAAAPLTIGLQQGDEPAGVPEPATLGLVAAGVVTLAACAVRRARRSA